MKNLDNVKDIGMINTHDFKMCKIVEFVNIKGSIDVYRFFCQHYPKELSGYELLVLSHRA